MNTSNYKKIFIFFFALAVIFRIGLFLYICHNIPDVIHEHDSSSYIRAADVITPFLKGQSETVRFGTFRSPGYPFFLSVLNGLLNCSWMTIVGIQLFLGIVTAFVVYKTACLIDKRWGVLSFLIVVLDPPLVIYSAMILTEAAFIFILSLFMYCFVRYIQDRQTVSLMLSAFLLAAAVYIRPAAMYLGYVTAVFVLYFGVLSKPVKTIIHCAMLCLIIYGCVYCWVDYNYQQYQRKEFTSINSATVEIHGLVGSYGRDKSRTYGNPVIFYISEFLRYSSEMMTTPGNFKYFNNLRLRKLGHVYGYLFVAVWIVGLFAGVFRYWRVKEIQFFVLMILYFWIGTVTAITWGASPRFRIPALPFIAVCSSAGWGFLMDKFYNKKIIRSKN